jgi:hypothetical protein
MSHHPKTVAPMPVRSCESGVEKLKQAISIALLAFAMTGCSYSASRDVRAYDACIARHPQEVAVCEGPRQAYELDPTAFTARAAATSPPAGE